MSERQDWATAPKDRSIIMVEFRDGGIYKATGRVWEAAFLFSQRWGNMAYVGGAAEPVNWWAIDVT
jgi:hypothetical protein